MPKQLFSQQCLLPALLVCPLIFIGAACADSTDTQLESLPLPEVLTPVRLKQPRTEVPASVSVIDADMIAASGIRELPEILRLIPGMAVGARSGWDYVVSYHGTNRHNAHRMQVMIDGRSIYQASLATIDWDDVPLAIEDIERIEVTRGPDTAAYGANAFLGIINIITKHPDDSPPLRTKVTAGNKSTTDIYASHSGSYSDNSYRVSAGARRDSGFDLRNDDTERRDSKSLQFVNGRWLVAPNANWQLDFQFGYKTGDKQDDYSVLDITPPDQSVDNYFANVVSQHFLSTNNSLKWQLDYSGTSNKTEWRRCELLTDIYPIDPKSPYANALICGDVNNNTRSDRVDIDVQDTWLADGPWKLVSGAHAQHQNVISETYYSGSAQRTNYQLFANFEYHFLPQWSATFAGSHEFFNDGDHAFSPRLALLYFPSENHSFRAVYSEAIRTPDLFESNAQWHYIARNLNTVPSVPLPLPAQQDLRTYPSPEHVRPERIRSRELGYYGLWFERRLEWDIKLFNDDMDDLISANPKYGSYNPVNAGVVKQRGYETELNLRIKDNLRWHLSAARIDSTANTPREEDLTPRTSGSAALVYDVSPGWQFSSFYYYAYPISDNKFTRWDNRIAKRFELFSSQLTTSVVVQHYFYKYSDLLQDNLYNGPNRIYLSVDLSF